MGIVTLWHKNGKKMMEGEWVNGVPHGPSLSWHENCQMKEQGTYRHGKRVGEWRTWDEEGRPLTTTRFDEER